jgi:hypothetical protein
MAKAREGDALYLKRGARSERFLAYDLELNLSAPLRLEGGPDKYTVVNTSPAPLFDVVIAKKTAEGYRVAWIDELPRGQPGANAAEPVNDAPPSAAPPATPPQQPAGTRLFGGLPPSMPGEHVEVTLSSAVPADSPEAAANTTQALADRLTKAGLTQQESKLFVDRYGATLFGSQELVVACRLERAVIDEKVPLSIFPAPAKTVRVAVVFMHNADPRMGDEVDQLVAQLGDAKWSVREAAQKRLLELGPVAYPGLQKALGSSDPEIVVRSERILLRQNQSLQGGAAPRQGVRGAGAVIRLNGAVVPAAPAPAPVIINR